MSERIQKGDLAEYAVIKFLLNKNYKIAKPVGSDWRYDLLLMRNEKFERLQIKWCNSNNDRITISGRSTSYSSKILYTKKDIDWLVGYDIRTDKCYFVPSELLGENGCSGIHLRFTIPKYEYQKQKFMLYAKDFENI